MMVGIKHYDYCKILIWPDWRTAAGKIVLEHGCIGRADWFAKRTLETTITKKTGAVVGVSFVAAFNKRGRHKS